MTRYFLTIRHPWKDIVASEQFEDIDDAIMHVSRLQDKGEVSESSTIEVWLFNSKGGEDGFDAYQIRLGSIEFMPSGMPYLYIEE